MKKKLLILATASILIAGCGGTKTIIREVAPSTTEAPYEEPYVAPSTNKYDDYYTHVINNSGKANSMAKSEIIEFGDVVCEALDAGRTVSFIVNFLEDYASTTSDNELFASIIFGAITYICNEHQGKLQSYLEA